jgi:hypothetical protein
MICELLKLDVFFSLNHFIYKYVNIGVFFGTMWRGNDQLLEESCTIPSWAMLSNSALAIFIFLGARHLGLECTGWPLVIIWWVVLCLTTVSWVTLVGDGNSARMLKYLDLACWTVIGLIDWTRDALPLMLRYVVASSNLKCPMSNHSVIKKSASKIGNLTSATTKFQENLRLNPRLIIIII